MDPGPGLPEPSSQGAHASQPRLTALDTSDTPAREGTLTLAERDRAVAALLDDLGTLHVVELSTDVAAEARALLTRHALRAGDAIQLASGVFLQRALGEQVPFVAFDELLRTAATDG